LSVRKLKITVDRTGPVIVERSLVVFGLGFELGGFPIGLGLGLVAPGSHAWLRDDSKTY
jgi:hypothetical protein